MLTRRQRIAAWIKADAQRRADAAALAAITERLTAKPQTSYDMAVEMWSHQLAREISKRGTLSRIASAGPGGPISVLP